jgi:hypothetical protein
VALRRVIFSRPCKRLSKVLFCTVDFTVCKVKFEIVSEIESLLKMV